MAGKGTAQRPDRLGLLLRREDTALQLERGEPEAVHHAPGLGHDLVGIERLAPVVRVGARMGRPLVEQVGGERHLVPHGAAEQVRDRAPGGPALDVQAGHLERREHPVGRRAVTDEAGRDRGLGRRDGLDAAVDLLGVIDVGALDDGGRGAQRVQVPLVGVGLAETGKAGVGGDLDDGAKRERFVHAHRVQQRRVGERDRRDRDLRDPHHAYAATATAG
jgi:hypothetical protein